MKQVELTKDLDLDEILRQASKEDVLLTRQGHAVALVSEIDDEEIYWYARERDPEFLASLASARDQVAKGKTIRHEELKKTLGLKRKS